MILSVTIPGRAVPMGSRSAPVTRGGRTWTFPAQSKALRAWQDAIAHAARLARPPAWPTNAAYLVWATCSIAAPKSDPRRGGPHSAKPDADKLLRAILDALTTAGVWRDDSQACDVRCAKMWSDRDYTRVAVEAVRLEDR